MPISDTCSFTIPVISSQCPDVWASGLQLGNFDGARPRLDQPPSPNQTRGHAGPSPIHDTLKKAEGFRHFATSITAPTASGWSIPPSAAQTPRRVSSLRSRPQGVSPSLRRSFKVTLRDGVYRWERIRGTVRAGVVCAKSRPRRRCVSGCRLLDWRLIRVQ